MQQRQPAIFVGHGSPQNAIENNAYTRDLQKWGKDLQKNPPDSILCISAHWWIRETRVTDGTKPRQIYDFSGFPPELHQIRYEPPGAENLPKQLAELDPTIRPDGSWGIDHGTWCVLHHLFPGARVPTGQLSINRNLSNQEHWDLGVRLRKLRDQGVLIVGSGNIVHSFFGISGPEDAPADPRAVEFDAKIKDALVNRDSKTLINYRNIGPSARFSAPTPEHFLPVIYIAALREEKDTLTFCHEGIQYASMSMRCFQIGN